MPRFRAATPHLARHHNNPASALRAAELDLPMWLVISSGTPEHWAQFMDVHIVRRGRALGTAENQPMDALTVHGFVSEDDPKVLHNLSLPPVVARCKSLKTRGF